MPPGLYCGSGVGVWENILVYHLHPRGWYMPRHLSEAVVIRWRRYSFRGLQGIRARGRTARHEDAVKI